ALAGRRRRFTVRPREVPRRATRRHRAGGEAAIAPEGVRRARELPEDPTNVEGPITDIEYRSPNQGDAKQKLVVQDDHSTSDRPRDDDHSNLRTADPPELREHVFEGHLLEAHRELVAAVHHDGWRRLGDSPRRA